MIATALAAGSLTAGSAVSAETAVAVYSVVGDAIPEPLDGKTGDAGRGRQLVLDRETGNCLICHRVPEPAERFQGDLGPDLAGVGSRLSEGQLRLRVIDQTRLNEATLMPPYHRVAGLLRVGARWRGRPVLDAQAIEDVVAYLSALKD